MKKSLLMLSLISLVSMSAFAATIDVKKSMIFWKGTKITGEEHFGKIFSKSSNLKLKKGNLVSGEIVLDINSFTGDDLEGKWAKKFLDHVKSADFFNVEKHSTAKLEITSIKGTQATGSLTIMGKTKKIIFPLLKFSKKYVGKVSFDRTQFGMTYGSKNFFKNLGDKFIDDIVEVDFEIFINK